MNCSGNTNKSVEHGRQSLDGKGNWRALALACYGTPLNSNPLRLYYDI